MPVDAKNSNGILYCPYCDAELARSLHTEDDFWYCDEDSCFGNEEALLWNKEGTLIDD